MEIVVYTREVKRRRWNRSGGSDFDIGGLDWIGHYIQIPVNQSGTEYFSENCQRKFRYLIIHMIFRYDCKFCRAEVTAYLSLIFILLVTFVCSIMESASIQMAKNYQRADVNRAMECVFAEYQKELLEEYDIFALDASYETGQYAEQNLWDRMDFYGAGSMEHQMERIQFLTDSGCSSFCRQVASYMEQKYGIDAWKDKTGLSSIWKQQEERADTYMEEEQEQQQYLEGLLADSNGELPEEENPITYVGQLKQSPILELVVPKEQSISEKQVKEGVMLPSRKQNRGYGTFSDVEDGEGTLSTLLFGEYLLEHFSMFTNTEHTGVLDYELEYVFAGKNSDRENLEAVVRRLMALRFVPNYIYIQTDSEMKAEAEAMAATLCSLLAVPAITEAAAQGILLAWSYGETIMDLRTLLSGNRVPMTKSKESWQLQLTGLLKLGTEEDKSEGQDVADGLDYREYLRMILFLKNKETVAERALGIIEQNMQKMYGQTYFRADLCVSRMEIKTTSRLRRGITYQYKTYYGYQ